MRMIFETISSKRAAARRPEAENVADDAEVGLREGIMVALQRFPEAAALSPLELEAAADRVIVQACPETASAAAPGNVRVSEINLTILVHSFTDMLPSVDELPGVAAGGVFPPGWIEARRRQLEEECRQENKTPGYSIGVLLAKVRVDLLTRGYVEVQKEYMQPD